VARTAQVNAWHRAWGKRNRNRTRLYNMRYRQKNRERCREWRRRYAVKHPTWQRAKALWVRYKLTLIQWDRMFKKQGGVCAICKRLTKNPGKGKPLVVDHDHLTGKVRGLLCHNCNLTLGKFEDRPEWFENIARYLRVHAVKT
jgi:hypothetical protein